MKSTIDRKLDLMARSLQEHIDLARELKLDFVAQLLTMTAMEIKLCPCRTRTATGATRVRAGDQFPDPHPAFLTGKNPTPARHLPRRPLSAFGEVGFGTRIAARCRSPDCQIALVARLAGVIF